MSETGAGRPGGPGQGAPEGPVAREAVLARAFVRLADTLASDFDIVDFLHGLSADSVEILRAEAAGVMLADARGAVANTVAKPLATPVLCGQRWNVGPAHGPQRTVLDDVPTPTDQKVGVRASSSRAVRPSERLNALGLEDRRRLNVFGDAGRAG